MDDRAFNTVPAETHDDNVRTPGALLAAVAAISFVICLAGFALKQVGLGVGAASLALLATGAALSWLTAESRRLRDAQRRRNFDLAAR